MKKKIWLTAMLMCFTCFLFAERIPEMYVSVGRDWKIKCDGISEDGLLYRILDPELVNNSHDFFGGNFEIYHVLLPSKELYEGNCIQIVGKVFDSKNLKELTIPEQIYGYKVIDCWLYGLLKNENDSDKLVE